MSTIKKMEIDKSRILRNLDLLLKILHQELKTGYLRITCARNKKFRLFEFKLNVNIFLT